MTIRKITKETNWLELLERFSSEHLKIEFMATEKPYRLFSIANCFDSGIDISNDYGFLCVKFKDIKKRDSFLNNTSISIKVEIIDKIKWRKIQYSTNEFPCRVFISDNNKLISFYSSSEELTNDEDLNLRIKVLRMYCH